jgi:hypothetical protein
MRLPQKSARERILETAEDLFYREGIHAVGIDTIIEKSGVAKMSLYRILLQRTISSPRTWRRGASVIGCGGTASWPETPASRGDSCAVYLRQS